MSSKVTSFFGESLSEAVFARKTELEENIDNWYAYLFNMVEKERKELFYKMLENEGKIYPKDLVGFRSKFSDALGWLWINVFLAGDKSIGGDTSFSNPECENVVEFAEKGLSFNIESLVAENDKYKQLLDTLKENGKTTIEYEGFNYTKRELLEAIRDNNEDIIRLQKLDIGSKKTTKKQYDELEGVKRKAGITSKPSKTRSKDKTITEEELAAEARKRKVNVDDAKRLKEITQRQRSDATGFINDTDFGRVYVQQRRDYIAKVYTDKTEKENMLKVYDQMNKQYEEGKASPPIQKYFERRYMRKKDGVTTIGNVDLETEPPVSIGGITLAGKRKSPNPQVKNDPLRELKLYEDVRKNMGGKISDGRLRNIVKTEVVAAYNMGRLHQMYTDRTKFVRWVNDVENRTEGKVCQICTIRAMGTSESLRKFAGKESLSGIYTIEDAFTNRQLAIPSHVNCFTEETLITKKDGTKKRIDEIKIGEQIQTSTIDCYNTDTRVKRISKRLYSGEIITFTLEDGRTIRTTPDHPFWNGEYYSSAKLLTEESSLYVFETLGKNTRELSKRPLFKQEVELCTDIGRNQQQFNDNTEGFESPGNFKTQQKRCVIPEGECQNNRKTVYTGFEKLNGDSGNLQNKINEIDIIDESLWIENTYKFRKSGSGVGKRLFEREEVKTINILKRDSTTSISQSVNGSSIPCVERTNVEKQSNVQSCSKKESTGKNCRNDNEWRKTNDWKTDRFWWLSGRFTTLLQIQLGSKFCENLESCKREMDLRKETVQLIGWKNLYSRFLLTGLRLLRGSERLVYGQSEREDCEISKGVSVHQTDNTRYEIISSPDQRFKTHRKLRIIQKKTEIVKDVYVYNLHVNNDEVYLANDIVVHNCLCQLRPISDSEEKALIVAGVFKTDMVNTASVVASIAGATVEGVNNSQIAKEGTDRSGWWYGALAVGGTAVAIGSMMWYLRKSLTSKYAAKLMKTKGVETFEKVSERGLIPIEIPDRKTLMSSLKLTDDIKLDPTEIKPQKYNKQELIALPELGSELPDFSKLIRDDARIGDDLLEVGVNHTITIDLKNKYKDKGLPNTLLETTLNDNITSVNRHVATLQETFQQSTGEKRNAFARLIAEEQRNLKTLEEMVSGINKREVGVTNYRMNMRELNDLFQELDEVPYTVGDKTIVLGDEPVKTQVKQGVVNVKERFGANGVVDTENNYMQEKLASLSQKKTITRKEYEEVMSFLRKSQRDKSFAEVALTNDDANYMSQLRYVYNDSPGSLREELREVVKKDLAHTELITQMLNTTKTLRESTPTYASKLREGSKTDRFITPKDLTRNDANIRISAIESRRKIIPTIDAILNYMEETRIPNLDNYYVLNDFSNILEVGGIKLEDFQTKNKREKMKFLQSVRSKLIDDARKIERVEFSRFQQKWAMFGSPR